MKIEQIYTGCLSQGAYYIESKGEAAIIDPLRDAATYLHKAEKDQSSIKYIFETHFHADFVSGHIDLAEKSGAQIVFGPGAETTYKMHQANDGEIFTIGDITIEVLHTPGHTLESSCFLLRDENGKAHALFSGDTLFIGDVGRPDLAQKGLDITTEDLAGMLYDSLRSKIMPLSDDILVYPAHGAGSACGKNMSKETWDTLGNQKATNYALAQDLSKADFIKELTTGIQAPPFYFGANVKMNKTGYDPLETVLSRGTIALDVEQFEAIANHEGALVLDTRHQSKFIEEHLPNSIFIGIDGGFAPWVGALITDIEQPIIIVADAGREEEVVTRLSRVGYDNTLGYLNGGIEAWKAAGKETDHIDQVPASYLEEHQNLSVIDVRKPGEYEAEHLEIAAPFPLDFINEQEAKFDSNKKHYIHCAGGYRSVIYISIMKSRGVHNLVDIAGGYKDIKETSLKRSNFVCPNS
ncbi:MAG: MBL fold metallo-hydrolase [Flavobacteriales bacterium]|nr:MBL fold metallo-hydrolase [Flavobacteriales bacterium]